MYQYETSPRKLTEYDIPKKEKKKAAKPKKSKKMSKEKIIEQETKMAKFNFTIILIFALGCLLLMMYRNVQINESFSEVQDMEQQIATLEKENSQISVNIQNSLNLNNIETTASHDLGMQKLTNRQTVYVPLDTKDYVEVSPSSVTETDEEESLVSKLWNKFLDLF